MSGADKKTQLRHRLKMFLGPAEKMMLTVPVHVQGPTLQAVMDLLAALREAFNAAFPDRTITDHCDDVFIGALRRQPYPFTAHLTVPISKKEALLEFLREFQLEKQLKGATVKPQLLEKQLKEAVNIKLEPYILYFLFPARPAPPRPPLRGAFPDAKTAQAALVARLQKRFPKEGSLRLEWQLFNAGRFCTFGELFVEDSPTPPKD